VSPKLVNRRIRLLFVILTIAFAATLARAAWLQGVRAEPLSRLAATQQRQTVELPARRGTIFDRNGVPLALGEQATTVYADPTQLKSARTVALAAERTLGVDAESIYPELQNRKRSFVYLERKADSTKADALRARKLPGVGFYAEERLESQRRSRARRVVIGRGGLHRGWHGLWRARHRYRRLLPDTGSL